LDPKGKVALINGGARIGQVVALTLAARGCSLALTYRNSLAAAQSTAAAARGAGVQALVMQADATERAHVTAAVNHTVSELGGIDILLNLAGNYEQTPDPTEADWAAAMDSNVKSAFLFATAAAPCMKSRGAGRIINFSDWLPVSGRPHYRNYVPYYTAKASVLALTQSLALELAPDILVNAIAPGPVLAPPDLNPEDNAEVLGATPLARWGGAEEIAKAVMFLIETEFVTGECIRVDGGRHLL
jgi:NAD(P)-dependent dehydrogenase (short-subunit alcohol dehydrogenase family)